MSGASGGRLDVVRAIEHKRDGGELDADTIAAIMAGHGDGRVSDAQLSALFMAGVLRGFSDDEAVALTDAYLRSGDVVDLSGLRGPTVDKHSTGGVADTTTFVVGPIVAACGAQLAKLSGRGLGHTGGTLDKLESIPGLRVDLSPDEVARQVDRIGLAVVAATADLAPADKRTYALRDVTGTVPSRALIAASIMAKKVAGGAESIVLDVKAGGGAFLSDPAEARALGELCITIGRSHGRRVAALVTDMSQPLGPAIGNALEVRAAIDTLRGRPGPLAEVSLALSARLLDLAGVPDAEQAARRALQDGTALERLRDLVGAQGGRVDVVDDPEGVLPAAPHRLEVTASSAGVVEAVDCRSLGVASVHLGAGRLRKEDPVDPAVGITMAVRVGDRVEAGQPVATVHARTPDDAEGVGRELAAALRIGEGGGDAPTARAQGPVLEVLGA